MQLLLQHCLCKNKIKERSCEAIILSYLTQLNSQHMNQHLGSIRILCDIFFCPLGKCWNPNFIKLVELKRKQWLHKNKILSGPFGFDHFYLVSVACSINTAFTVWKLISITKGLSRQLGAEANNLELTILYHKLIKLVARITDIWWLNISVDST